MDRCAFGFSLRIFTTLHGSSTDLHERSRRQGVFRRYSNESLGSNGGATLSRVIKEHQQCWSQRWQPNQRITIRVVRGVHFAQFAFSTDGKRAR
jgi:hypothetical protein